MTVLNILAHPVQLIHGHSQKTGIAAWQDLMSHAVVATLSTVGEVGQAPTTWLCWLWLVTRLTNDDAHGAEVTCAQEDNLLVIVKKQVSQKYVQSTEITPRREISSQVAELYCPYFIGVHAVGSRKCLEVQLCRLGNSLPFWLFTYSQELEFSEYIWAHVIDVWQAKASAIVSALSGEEYGDWLVMPALGTGPRRSETCVISFAMCFKCERGVWHDVLGSR